MMLAVSNQSSNLMGRRQLDAVTAYLPTEIKQKLEAWAHSEDRSVSYLVARLITEAVEAKEKQSNENTPA
ncbi:CopG family transcriptional regulator [Trichocoleus sp. FACHB-591]|uniref:ribbon-helix-helix domain-containing protein n=1 Tax=Trichocoleus sp. FACHB-591 TaxID=2692872 RepID=UPI0018EFBB95